MSKITTGIIGMGFVGGAIYKSFKLLDIEVNGYDKFNNKGDVKSLKDLKQKDILFLCLPTLFSYKKNEYDKSAINEVCENLSNLKYKGLVVIKSTVEPGFCEKISKLIDFGGANDKIFPSSSTIIDLNNPRESIFSVVNLFFTYFKINK